ncbi:hypothetical protein [Gorillibacterium sp. sgz5001074]|uniref:hypothetical protein n=1 Tax=Gorillibacterium sp. sgz5001074 TaxID=3446695 RepID=UPI003F66CBFE
MAGARASRKIRITGTGDVSGGEYGSIHIVGESHMTGDVSCGTLKCTGNLKAAGSLTAELMKLSGEGDVEGDLRAGAAFSLGQIRVHGRVKAGRMRMRGWLEADGDWECEHLSVKGGFRAAGLLNAGELDIRLFGPCSAQEVAGGTVRVSRSRLQSMKEWFRPQGPSCLTAALIEADRVELAHTKADTVRGKRVVIGPGCTIGEVEYTETLVIHRSSRVQRKTKH